MAGPRLELHWIPDPGFLFQGFLIQCLHRLQGLACPHVRNHFGPSSPPWAEATCPIDRTATPQLRCATPPRAMPPMRDRSRSRRAQQELKEADGQLVVQAIPKSRPKRTASAKPMRPAPITPPRRPRVPPPPPPMPPAAHDVPPEFGGAATEQQAAGRARARARGRRARASRAGVRGRAGRDRAGDQGRAGVQGRAAGQGVPDRQGRAAVGQEEGGVQDQAGDQGRAGVQEFKARQLAEEESEIEQEEFKAWQLAQQELKATAEGHPECMQCEDCVGSRASLLLRNYIKDTVSGLHCEGDVYCWECFDCFRTHLPNGHNMVFIK